MARLILMRHAKSSWTSGAATDHARPLNKRGRRDAPRMAQALVERDWLPDLVLSSDSERTRATWARMSDVIDAPTVFTRELYHAGYREIVAVLERERGDAQTVLVLGHNPGWEDALEWFTGDYKTMTTANCALLERDDWDVNFAGDFELIELLRPRELDD